LNENFDESFYKQAQKIKEQKPLPTPIKEEIAEEDFGEHTGKEYGTAMKPKTEKSISEHYSEDTFEEAQDLDKTFPAGGVSFKKETEEEKKELKRRIMAA